MRKTAAAMTLITALLITATAGTILVNLAIANPVWSADFPREPDKNSPTIMLHSPLQNQTFNFTNILLNFTVTKPETWFKDMESSNLDYIWILGNITYVSYKVDGGKKQNIPVHDTSTLYAAYPNRTLNFSLNLTLPEGKHNLTVGVESESYYVTPGYLTGPPFSITVHGESELVDFTVAQPEPEPEAFSVVPIAAAFTGVAVAATCIGFFVYFKKRKRQEK